MLITVVNQAQDVLWDHSKLLKVVRALNRQIAEDFEPHWNLSARVRLANTREAGPQPHPATTGGPVIYLTTWKNWSVENVLRIRETGGYCKGFHERTQTQFPIAYIFVDHPPNGDGPAPPAQVFRSDWVVTLSHEILETIVNPHLNLWAKGPHPDPERAATGETVYVAREVCDPVQDEYQLDGVRVANFVLPLFFLNNGHETERVDFLDTRDADGRVHSFGVRRGGYMPFRTGQCRVRPLDGQSAWEEVEDKLGRSHGTGALVPLGFHQVHGHLPVEPAPQPEPPPPKRPPKRSPKLARK